MIDSSGVTGVLTKKAKSHTASFLEVAVPINRINIPPGLNSFEINTTCHVSTGTFISFRLFRSLLKWLFCLLLFYNTVIWY